MSIAAKKAVRFASGIAFVGAAVACGSEGFAAPLRGRTRWRLRHRGERRQRRRIRRRQRERRGKARQRPRRRKRQWKPRWKPRSRRRKRKRRKRRKRRAARWRRRRRPARWRLGGHRHVRLAAGHLRIPRLGHLGPQWLLLGNHLFQRCALARIRGRRNPGGQRIHDHARRQRPLRRPVQRNVSPVRSLRGRGFRSRRRAHVQPRRRPRRPT